MSELDSHGCMTMGTFEDVATRGSSFCDGYFHPDGSQGLVIPIPCGQIINGVWKMLATEIGLASGYNRPSKQTCVSLVQMANRISGIHWSKEPTRVNLWIDDEVHV